MAQGLAVFSDTTFAELETRIWKPKFDLYISLDLLSVPTMGGLRTVTPAQALLEWRAT